MKQSSAMMVGVGKWENAVRMSVVVWVVVDSFVNLEPEIFFGSLLPEVAVVGKIRPSAALQPGVSCFVVRSSPAKSWCRCGTLGVR